MNDMRKLMESLENIQENKEPEDILPITAITSPSGDYFTFNAVRYNITPNDLVVKIWYGSTDIYEEAIEIDFAVLKRMIDTIERKL